MLRRLVELSKANDDWMKRHPAAAVAAMCLMFLILMTFVENFQYALKATILFALYFCVTMSLLDLGGIAAQSPLVSIKRPMALLTLAAFLSVACFQLISSGMLLKVWSLGIGSAVLLWLVAFFTSKKGD